MPTFKSRVLLNSLRTGLAGACALIPLCASAEPLELTTAGRDSPPFFMVKGGKASGVCPDIYAALERVDPTLRIRGAEKLLSLAINEKALETGHNVINCGMGKSPHRDAFLRYVERVATTSMVLAVRADDPIATVASLDELAVLAKNSPVIVRRATVFADRLKERGIAVDDSGSDNAENLRRLLLGRGRFYYHIDFLLIEQLRDPAIAGKVRILPTKFEAQPMYLVVSKKVDVSVDRKLAAAYAVLRKSGELDAIFKKYDLQSGP